MHQILRKAQPILLAALLATATPARAAAPACELRISDGGQALVDASLREGYGGKVEASYTLWLAPGKTASSGFAQQGTLRLLLGYAPQAFSPRLMLGTVRDASGKSPPYLDVELDIDGVRQSTSGSGDSVNFDWEFPGQPAASGIHAITVRIYDVSLARQRDFARRTASPVMVLQVTGAEVARAQARAEEAIATLKRRAAKRQCSIASSRFDESDEDY